MREGEKFGGNVRSVQMDVSGPAYNGHGSSICVTRSRYFGDDPNRESILSTLSSGY